MDSLFSSTDYRELIRTRLAELKLKDRSFTYEAFAQKAGFKSKSFLSQVLQGRSKLSKEMALKFAVALDLGKSHTDFFVHLVEMNQARSHSEKSRSTEKLLSLKNARVKTVEKAHFEFYKKWYYSAVRSLLAFYSFDGDYKKLGRTLSPPITEAQAKTSINLLSKLRFIKKADDGKLTLSNEHISTGSDHQSVAVINYQLETMDLAKKAVQELPREQRSASTVTLGVSAEGQRRINEKIASMRKELVDIAQADTHIDRVVQVNLHVFPLTRLSEGEPS